MNPGTHAAKFGEWRLCVKTLLTRGKRAFASGKNGASALVPGQLRLRIQTLHFQRLVIANPLVPP